MRRRGFTLPRRSSRWHHGVVLAAYGAVGFAAARARATERAEQGAAARTVLPALAHEPTGLAPDAPASPPASSWRTGRRGRKQPRRRR
jgi:hypothetical protein